MELTEDNFLLVALLVLGLPGLVGLAAIVWLKRERAQHQRGASRLINLEVASCALMPNGDVIIRRRRFRSLFVVLVGLGTVLSCSAIAISSVLERTAGVFELGVLAVVVAFGTLILLVSIRALLAPDIVVDKASLTVKARPGWIRRAQQAWRFDSIEGISARPPYKRMDALASITDVPFITEIRLRLRSGETVFLCIAPKAKSEEVLDLLSDAIGKPVLQRAV